MALRLVVTFLVLLLPSAALGDQEHAPAAPEFVDRAASLNMFEVRASVVALATAESAAVKAFARQMIKDHSKALADLAISVSRTDGGLQVNRDLAPQQQDILKALSLLSGREFDLAYVTRLLAVHEAALALYTAYAGGGDDARLMAFARERHATTLKHLHMFRALDRFLNS